MVLFHADCYSLFNDCNQYCCCCGKGKIMSIRVSAMEAGGEGQA